jgi:hypothetical protein
LGQAVYRSNNLNEPGDGRARRLEDRGVKHPDVKSIGRRPDCCL